MIRPREAMSALVVVVAALLAAPELAVAGGACAG